MQNSSIEISYKNSSILMPPPLPPNRSTIEGFSSFKTILSHKSLNYSRSPRKTTSFTKLTSEELSQTKSYRYAPLTKYYNHKNMINQRKNSEINKIENLTKIYINNNSNKININKKFIEQEKPTIEKEIQGFVDYLINYINFIFSLGFDKYTLRNIIALKDKIEVRYFDYKNKGLKQEYFIECLMEMQTELIAFISRYNDKIIYDKFGNIKSIDIDENRQFFSLFT